jgi:hypothetical protein
LKAPAQPEGRDSQGRPVDYDAIAKKYGGVTIKDSLIRAEDLSLTNLGLAMDGANPTGVTLDGHVRLTGRVSNGSQHTVYTISATLLFLDCDVSNAGKFDFSGLIKPPHGPMPPFDGQGRDCKTVSEQPFIIAPRGGLPPGRGQNINQMISINPVQYRGEINWTYEIGEIQAYDQPEDQQ